MIGPAVNLLRSVIIEFVADHACYIVADLKPGELLEHPGRGNQQPRAARKRGQGSETRSRTVAPTGVGSNAPTSAGRYLENSDDIVRTARIIRQDSEGADLSDKERVG